MRVLVGDTTQEANLLPIAPAPTAYKQMEFQAEALRQRQRLAGRHGLEPADFAAGGPQCANSGTGVGF